MSQAGTSSNGGGGSSGILTVTGTSGGAVGPDMAGNVNLLGAGGVVVTGNAGTNTLTISVSGSGIVWNTVTTNTAMVASNGYITNSASPITLALPGTAAVGDTFAVTGLGAGGWVISQQAGQNIISDTVSTTIGTGGSLTSSNRYDDLSLVCIVANTTFKVRNSGTYTVA